MSCIMSAFVLNEFISMECIEETLREMKVDYSRTERGIDTHLTDVSAGSQISFRRNGRLAEILIDGRLPDDFMRRFASIHGRKVAEEVERLRRRELEIREASVLKGISEEERLVEGRRLRIERMELESLMASQAEEKRLKIEQIRRVIMERAESTGYAVKEEVRGNAKRLVLVRRT